MHQGFALIFRGVAVATLLQISALLLVPANPAHAQKLAEFTEGTLNYELVEEPETFRLLIRPKGGLENLDTDLTANVFALPKPSRLVVDVPHFSAKTARTVTITNSKLSAIRIGVHTDKTRLVIDIQGEKPPSYNIHSDAALGALVVDFGLGTLAPNTTGSKQLSAGSGKKDKPELPEILDTVPENPPETIEPAASGPGIVVGGEIPPKAPSTVDTHGGSPSAHHKTPELITEEQPPAELITKSPEADSKQPSEALPVEPETPQIPAAQQTGGTPSAGVSTVKGVFYQSSKNAQGSSVVIDVDSLNTYSLSQRDANAYELVLEKTKLAGEHLTLPQFPPDTFKGFEVLLASQRGENVIIKIYVEDGIRLTPFIQKGQLWLRAGQ